MTSRSILANQISTWFNLLLDAWAGRVNFPELKQRAREFYEQHKPDSLIESKATHRVKG